MSIETPDEPVPRRDAEASIEESSSGIGTTAARALALGASLTAPELLNGLDGDLSRIGIDRLPSHSGGWDERQVLVTRSDAVLERYGALAEVQEAEASAAPATDEGQPPSETPASVCGAS